MYYLLTDITSGECVGYLKKIYLGENWQQK